MKKDPLEKLIAGFFFAFSLLNIGTSIHHFYRDPNSLFGAMTFFIGIISMAVAFFFND